MRGSSSNAQQCGGERTLLYKKEIIIYSNELPRRFLLVKQEILRLINEPKKAFRLNFTKQNLQKLHNLLV